MQEILDFLQSLDWSPLVISIKTGIVATILSFFFGIFAARAVMKLRPGARAVIDGFLTLPMILPPTVAGFFLLLIFSLRRPFGVPSKCAIVVVEAKKRKTLCCRRSVSSQISAAKHRT